MKYIAERHGDVWIIRSVKRRSWTRCKLKCFSGRILSFLDILVKILSIRKLR